MLSTEKDETYRAQAIPGQTVQAQAASPSAKRGPRANAPSIVAADVVVKGALTSTGDMQIG